MFNKVFEFCKEKNLICKDDYVVAGISGGADSVCLLYMLLEMKKRINFTIHVVHINHGIREEAKADAEYVEGLAKKHKLSFTLMEYKVEEYAKENHLSCEEAGRIIRYKAFFDTLEQNRGSREGKIAIAHNENDLAETFLFNLFRGSGLKGLSGIAAKRDEIIRPLLCLSRAEIEEYLNQNEIRFMIDKTNLTDEYTRNKIRHHILPEAEKSVSGAVSHIKEAASKIDEAYQLIEEMTRIEYDKCVILKKDNLIILKKEFDILPEAMKGYVAKLAFEKQTGKSKDVTAIHIRAICELMANQVGRKINLPYEIQAARIYDGIELKKASEIEETKEWEIRIKDSDFDKEITLPNNDTIVISVKELAKLDDKNIPNNTYTKWLDYDKIKGSICVRNRRLGDYFVIDDSGHKKTMKSFFTDKKTPANQRDKQALLTNDSHVLWIIGDRISNEFKIQNDTKRILEVRFIPYKESEE